MINTQPLDFIITMDLLASSIQRDPPWAMLFADDLVLYVKNLE